MFFTDPEEIIEQLEAKNKRLQAENERLREALKSCELAVENTNWGWDGDCGLGNHIDYIVETALEGGDA